MKAKKLLNLFYKLRSYPIYIFVLKNWLCCLFFSVQVKSPALYMDQV